MESIEIKSKRNIRRKRYQNCLKQKKEMTPILGFGFGRFFFTKSLLLRVLKLKNNLEILKNNFKLTLTVPAGNWVAILLPPNYFMKMVGC
jgi:hypothetical protein